MNDLGIHGLTRLDLLREALREYEHERTIDLILFPYHLLRWCIAWLWTQAWGWWRVLRGADRAWAFMWGRHDSPEPVICRYCLWAGAQRECYHDYTACGDDDVEPQDCCPRCDGEII